MVRGVVTAKGTWSLSAEWVLPADGTVLHRGVIRGRGATIEAVGPERRVPVAPSHRELGEVAVLPGLVNAHTHLELTHLRGQLPAGRPLPQWLFALRARWPATHDLDAAVEDGAAEALATGTTALADTCRNHRAWRTLRKTPLRALCLAEVTGIGPLADAAIPRLRKHICGCRSSRRMRFGISPHAPYTTAEAVYRQAVALARRRRWPIATHLAETEGERQFLLRGSGRLFDFLMHMGLMSSKVEIPGCTPVAFARRVGLLEGPCLLAHVNFVDDAEMRVLAASGASVVCCPRSNDFFGRSGHRYAEMLHAGINVALGTDSLASNASLDMLAEMARLRAEAKVDNQTLLKMATLHGARALGWDDSLGSLEPGKQADWIAVEVPPGTLSPLEAIVTGHGRVVEVAIAAKTVYTAKAP
jgi:cytosine/adenosine deaminase-related metal-dependent hydrolase